MYLTRFELNTARRGTRDLLTSPQRVHAAVVNAFPAAHREPTRVGRVLWRIDQRGNQTLLYILSPHTPDLTHLVERAGWPTTASWDTRPYTPLLDRLTVGGTWAFRLTANPVRSTRTTPDAPRSQRLGHVTVAQQTQWLLDRAPGFGFTIPDGVHNEPDVTVHSRRTWRFRRQDHMVTLATATLEGHLEVTDPEALRYALTHGIGPAKGYGCGLLTLAQAKRHA